QELKIIDVDILCGRYLRLHLSSSLGPSTPPSSSPGPSTRPSSSPRPVGSVPGPGKAECLNLGKKRFVSGCLKFLFLRILVKPDLLEWPKGGFSDLGHLL
ncbi:hypothetical protein Tco_1306204, partial [Tanacetum coccineum]